MNVWLVILIVGLGSYLFRAGMVLLVDRVDVPERLGRASAFVAPAAFAALAAGGVATGLAGSETVRVLPPLAAVVVAGLAAHLTRRPEMALLAGMPALWVLSALLPAS